MQDDDMISDELIEDSSDTDFEEEQVHINKGDSRRKLEDYLERKRLESEFNYY
jgi:hypothetical protein